MLEKSIYKLISVLYCIVFAWIFILMFVFGKMDYAAKTSYNNFLLLPLGLIIVIVVGVIAKSAARILGDGDIALGKKKWIVNLSVAVVGILFMLMQNFLISQYYFKTGWDAGVVLYNVDLLAHGYNVMDEYFAVYPNNKMILYVMYFVAVWANYLGGEAAIYPSLLCSMSTVCMLTGWLLFSCARIVWKRLDVALWVYFLYLIFIGLSPWFSIPYTDAYSVLFPVLILRLYLVKEVKLWKKVLKWIFIGVVTALGYKMKPQTIMVAIALVGVDCVRILSDVKNHWKSVGCLGMMLVGLILGSVMMNNRIDSMTMESLPNMEVSWQHYFKMGMNESAMGCFNDPDYDYIYQISDAERLKELEWDEAWERIHEMGPKRLGVHFCRKALTNYNDGTFSWNKEGNFYKEVPEHGDGWLADQLKELVYNSEYHWGKNFTKWCNWNQAIWLVILILAYVTAWACLLGRRMTGAMRSLDHAMQEAETLRVMHVVMLSILGLTLFELIFEARARYVFSNAAIFLFLAGAGMTAALDLKERVINKEK